jgi:hypothetical protein
MFCTTGDELIKIGGDILELEGELTIECNISCSELLGNIFRLLHNSINHHYNNKLGERI